jgi:hypothetical protein
MNGGTAKVENELAHIVELAESKIKRFQTHSLWAWHSHNVLLTISLIATLIVPFGLAGLLYAAEPERLKFNKLLLVISAVAAGSQLVDYLLGFRARAERLRRWSESLRHGLAKFRDGAIGKDDFLRICDEVSNEYANEDAI